jgi:hypothetical protein
MFLCFERNEDVKERFSPLSAGKFLTSFSIPSIFLGQLAADKPFFYHFCTSNNKK